MEHSVPVLCRGTFFTIIIEAKRQGLSSREHASGKTSEYTEANMFVGLLNVCSNYPKPGVSGLPKLKARVSQYKNCDRKGARKFSFFTPGIVKVFCNGVVNDYESYLEKMDNFVQEFINTGEVELYSRIAYLLVELLEFDDSIKASDMLYIQPDGKPLAKSELKRFHDSANTIYLPALFLGIWHFVLSERPDNTIGKDTIDLWLKKLLKDWPEYDNRVANGKVSSVRADIPVATDRAISEWLKGAPKSSYEEEILAEAAALKIQAFFLSVVDKCGIMGIIARTPPVLTWEDADAFVMFREDIDSIPMERKSIVFAVDKLYQDIRIFYGRLLQWELLLKVKLDKKGKQDSVNMEANRCFPEHLRKHLFRFSTIKEPVVNKSGKSVEHRSDWDLFYMEMIEIIERIRNFAP